MQVWAESVPAAPEMQGCAAALDKDTEQQHPEDVNTTSEAQSIQSQQTQCEQSWEAVTKAGGETANAVAPHPLLSIPSPSRQKSEVSDSDALASAHPLMQVRAACCAIQLLVHV